MNPQYAVLVGIVPISAYASKDRVWPITLRTTRPAAYIPAHRHRSAAFAAA